MNLPPVSVSFLDVLAEGRLVPVRIAKPAGVFPILPVVLYLLGGRWELVSATKHYALVVRDPAIGVHAAVVFVECHRSAESQPTEDLEHAYAVARWVQLHGVSAGLDPNGVAVIGDSARGDLAAALTTVMTSQGQRQFVHKSLCWPSSAAPDDTAQAIANVPTKPI